MQSVYMPAQWQGEPVNMLGLKEQVSVRCVCVCVAAPIRLCAVLQGRTWCSGVLLSVLSGLLSGLQLPIGLIPASLPYSTAGLLEWCAHLLQGFACVLHNLRGLAAAPGFTNRAAMGCGRVGRGLAGLGGFEGVCESVSVLWWQRTGCTGCRERLVQVVLFVSGTRVSMVHRTTHKGARSLCAEQIN